MPNLKSSVESMRKSHKRRLRNRHTKARLRTLTKQIKRCAAQDPSQVPTLLKAFYSVLDKAALKRVIKKNAVARKKSDMMHYLRTVNVPKQSVPSVPNAHKE